jgi:hypothetical protein
MQEHDQVVVMVHQGHVRTLVVQVITCQQALQRTRHVHLVLQHVLFMDK